MLGSNADGKGVKHGSSMGPVGAITGHMGIGAGAATGNSRQRNDKTRWPSQGDYTLQQLTRHCTDNASIANRGKAFCLGSPEDQSGDRKQHICAQPSQKSS